MVGVILLIVGIVVVSIGVWYFFFSYDRDDSHPIDRISTVQRTKISIDMNRFAARKETKASTARTGLAVQLNQETAQYIEMINQQTSAQIAEYENMMALPRKQREDLMAQALQQNQLIVVQAANELRVTPEVYSQLVLERSRQETQLAFQRAQQDLDIQKHFQMKLIEYKMEELIAGLEKEMIQFNNLLPHHELTALHSKLSLANRNLDSFRRADFPSEELKNRELRRMEDYVRTLERNIRERKKRLL